MAMLDEHCRDCEKALGEPFRHVHEWLDEHFAAMGPRHRIMRHHKEGIEEIRKKWGDKAARAAEIHIKKDNWGEGVHTKEQMLKIDKDPLTRLTRW